jgi:hypothetical protein
MRAFAGTLLDTEHRRLRRRGTSVVTFQPSRTVLEVMGVNAMDPSRRGAIAAAARTATLQRLARADVHQQLAALR